MKSISCPRTQALLERYLDGDIAPERVAILEAHFETCASCRAEREAATRVRAGLRALPRYRCPEVVATTVLAQVEALQGAAANTERAVAGARAGASKRRTMSWSERIRRAGWEVWWRPTLAGVGVAATALFIVLLARAPEAPAPPDAVAVERAEEEVRWAFAYVAQVTRHASDTALETTMSEIVGTVIGERVVAPVTNAVNRPLEEDRTP